MPAQIEGYTYDIFISYRQNDNRYDGWVTEFVTNLKKELEATIKDKLTVYFDENPLDGLLETHSVDNSLNDKLRCLILIPIISQTYCDINGYAWKNEFCLFNKLSGHDSIGKNIRLPNGNVSGRILAVKIHDIDHADLNEIEKETGQKLRSIDFIYRSAGVNRPLRALEEHPRNNLNRTNYRDQINKIANAVKEIITALKTKTQDSTSPELVDIMPEKIPARVRTKGKILAGSLLTIILGTLTILYATGSIKPNNLPEKSIAVLPFRNDSPSDSNTYFINGVMEEILNNLQTFNDVRIISRTSVEQYRNTSKSIPQIAKELGVNYIVEGSGQRMGNSFRLNVKLVRAKKENYLWSDQYDQKINNPGDIIGVQSTIAKTIVTELKGTITPDEIEMIEKIPTTNLTAYDYYQKGREELSKFWIDNSNTRALENSEKQFNKALQSDPAFAKAIVGQAEVLWHKYAFMQVENLVDSVFMLTDIALSYDNKISEAFILKGWCFDDGGQSDKAREVYMRAMELNPSNWKAYFGLAELYDFEEPVKALQNLQKAVSLTHGLMEMPTLLRHIGGQLLVTGYIDEAGDYFSRAFELDGDSAIYLSCLGGIEQNQGHYESAIGIYKESLSLKSNYNEVIHNLAVNTHLMGSDTESLKYYRELEARNAMNFNMHRMGYALVKNGYEIEGADYLSKHIEYCNRNLRNGRRSDLIIYTYYDLAGIYAFLGDKTRAYQNLRLFAQSRNSYLYMVTLMKNDPLFEGMKNEPEFRNILNQMETKFSKVHNDVGKWLAAQDDF